MSRCPACAGPMGEITAGAVSVDLCGSCGGMWLDYGELEKIGEPDAALLSGAPAATAEAPAPRYCPHCFPRLLAQGRQGDVTIDACPSCNGIWLDPGELAALRAKRRRRRLRASRPYSDGDPVPLSGFDILCGLLDLAPGF